MTDAIQVVASVLAIVVSILELVLLARRTPNEPRTGVPAPIQDSGRRVLRVLLGLGAAALLVAAVAYLFARDGVEQISENYEGVPGNFPEVSIVAAGAALVLGAASVYIGSWKLQTNEGLIPAIAYVALGIVIVLSVSALPGEALGSTYE